MSSAGLATLYVDTVHILSAAIGRQRTAELSSARAEKAEKARADRAREQAREDAEKAREHVRKQLAPLRPHLPTVQKPAVGEVAAPDAATARDRLDAARVAFDAQVQRVRADIATAQARAALEGH